MCRIVKIHVEFFPAHKKAMAKGDIEHRIEIKANMQIESSFSNSASRSLPQIGPRIRSGTSPRPCPVAGFNFTFCQRLFMSVEKLDVNLGV